MEQDRTCWPSPAPSSKLVAIRAALPPGISVSTYDRSAWIWATLKQFFATLLSERSC